MCTCRYQKAPDRDTYRYEEEFFDYLTYLHNDLERKIRRGKERKDKEVDENVSLMDPFEPSAHRCLSYFVVLSTLQSRLLTHLSSVSALTTSLLPIRHHPFQHYQQHGNRHHQLLNPRKDEKEEKMVMLEQKIKDTLAKVEEAGEEGRVEEAQVLTDQVEKMQADLQQLKQNDDVNPIFRQENKMEVCHVCGAFLVMNDTSNRLDSHLQGKQHTGYQKIHETYEEMKKQRGDRPHSSSSRGGRYRDDYGGSGPQREHYSDSRGDRDRGGYRDSRSYRDQPYRRDDRRDRDRDRDGGRRDRSRDRGGRRDYDRDRDYRRGGRDDRRF